MENVVQKIIERHFHETPTRIERMKMGICNEVYAAHLNDKEIVIRLSTQERNLIGSHYYIPLFRTLGIKVPEMLAEDYSKSLVPYYYQIQNRIKGKDLGDVIQTLTDEQLKNLAKDIASVINKVRTIPSSDKFGQLWGNGGNLSDSWTERMKIRIQTAEKWGKKTGVMDDQMKSLAERIYEKYKTYFDSVKPVTCYDDISSKNVMVHDGVFSGLVDLDSLTQGDVLESLGRIKLCWYGAHYGEVYNAALMDYLKLTAEEKNMVTVYSLVSSIAFACENGMKFNDNTSGVVDQEKLARDKQRMRAIAHELGISF